MAEAFIKGHMLRWARERLDLTITQLAQMSKISSGLLEEWENTGSYPSINQALDLSNKLKIPFGYLYLSTPPKEYIPLPDLRTMANKTIEKPSPDFLDVVFDALRKQQWYKDYLTEENASKLEFAGKYNTSNKPDVIAKDIRDTLGINDDLRKESMSWELFLTAVIRRAEAARIIVLRNGVVGNNAYRKLDTREFRGFAIFDDIAPLVFINGNDYKTAQIFTLMHEIAHIWVGQSGISNLDFQLKDSQQYHSVDKLCDSIASEVLVPTNELNLKWDFSRELRDNIDILARHFRVSSFVVLRVAFIHNIITETVFREKYYDLLTKIKKPTNKKEEGNFYNLLKSRNSVIFTTTLIAGMVDGSVSPKEVADLLNIRPASLKDISNQVLVW